MSLIQWCVCNTDANFRVPCKQALYHDWNGVSILWQKDYLHENIVDANNQPDTKLCIYPLPFHFRFAYKSNMINYSVGMSMWRAPRKAAESW